MLPPRSAPAIDTRRVRSLDGTDIAYHVTESPFAGAPWVVLANGLGGTWHAWRGQIDYLRDRYRFVTWDYRGLHGSGRPSPDVTASYAVAHHARDLEAILAAEHIERPSLVGWSMGVQVVLEAFHRRRVAAHDLVLINGTYGRPLEALAPLPGMRAATGPLLGLARRAHGLASRLTRATAARPGAAAAVLKRLGLVGELLDDARFPELVNGLAQLDTEAYFRNLDAIGRHDAGAGLGAVDVPTLIITGDADRFTPRPLAQQMARRIPDAEILVVRGGTHYTPLEYPELVSLRLERFWRERGFC